MKEMWLWLCSIPGLYRPQMQELLAYFETPEEVFKASVQEIQSFVRISEKQRNNLLKMRSSWDGEKERNALQEKEIRFISCTDPGYPCRLRNICDYPYGLFVKGALPDDAKPAVAVVGARKCSSYGKHFAREIAAGLAEHGIQIVSGMARGIDGEAQKAAVEAEGSSFAVLGSGVDICYPAEHAALYRMLTGRGGILSEYLPGTSPLPIHFPMRNRIISGLADLIVVVEAREKSGSLITADLGLEQGKEIVAVPGRIGDVGSAGCNRLIAEGADIFWSVEQLFHKLNVEANLSSASKKSNITLETEEKLVYSVLEFQAKNLQTIADETGLTPKEAGSVLVRLQLGGLVLENSKNYYVKA